MDLEPTQRLIANLKLVYNIPTIHVTGTNGKGSVVAYLCGMLMASGLRVGSFTSPHLVELRDSIQIDNLPVGGIRFHDVMARIAAVASIDNSPFEELTAAALVVFQEYRVDVAVVETGLGASWDATMVVPDSSVVAGVITSIGLDHVGVLGNNEVEIARSKSCVARLGRPLVLNRDISSAAFDEIAKQVKPLKCPIIRSPTIEKGESTAAFSVLGVQVPALKMRGQHQQSNFAVAAATVLNLLGHLGTLLRKPELHKLRASDILIKAAKTVRVPGRMECLPWPPLPAHKLKADRHNSSESARSLTLVSCSSTVSSVSSIRPMPLVRTNTMPLSVCVQNQCFYFDPPGVQTRLGSTKRLVWLDGAHNSDGLRAIDAWLQRSDLAIIGFSIRTSKFKGRKSATDLIKCLSHCQRVAFTRFCPPADQVISCDPIECCEIYAELFPDKPEPLAFYDLTAAFEEAERLYHHQLAADKTAMEVIVTGSLYLVADYYKHFLVKR